MKDFSIAFACNKPTNYFSQTSNGVDRRLGFLL